MDLSVIVPCHNLEKFIKPLLDSLKLQQFTYEVELIFVCDYCIDRTHEIIEEEMVDTQYPISIYDVDVRSCGLARNKGMKYATGTYIWFMDGDDWLIDNSAIQKVLNTMKYYPHEILALEYNAPGFGFKGHPSMVWQYVFNREFIGDLQFLEVQPHEDLYFVQELFQRPHQPIFKIQDPLYHYNYMREGSNMQQLFTTGEIKP